MHFQKSKIQYLILKTNTNIFFSSNYFISLKENVLKIIHFLIQSQIFELNMKESFKSKLQIKKGLFSSFLPEVGFKFNLKLNAILIRKTS